MKEIYERLQKSYNLPSYKNIDNEFELGYLEKDIKKTNYPLRNIRRRQMDKIMLFTNFLQSFIIPNPNSIVNMQESKFLTDEQRNTMVNIIQQLMILERKSLILEVEQSETKDAEFITECLGQWLKIKKELVKFSKVLLENWQIQNEEKKSNYFG